MVSQIIAVAVSCQGQEDVVFKIKDDTNLSKLMERYCQQILNKNVNDVVFTYEGIEVKKDDTPVRLKMKDQDTIHVSTNQIGGSNE